MSARCAAVPCSVLTCRYHELTGLTALDQLALAPSVEGRDRVQP